MAIVVSHIASDFESLTQAALRQVALADLIELRLDHIGHPGKEQLKSFFQACPKPVIVTIHGSEGFGDYSGTTEERLDLLYDAAEAGARFVDVDYRLSLELGEVPAPSHRIVSRHELGGTPEDPAELDAMLEEVRAVLYEGDVMKFITHAESTEDGLRYLRWLRTTKAVVGFCSGEAGTFTRALAPVFGSPFTYCAPALKRGESEEDGAHKTAPGQIRVNDLRALQPPGGINQETAIFGVVGNPIGHSYSPWVHGMALKGARLDAIYVAFEPSNFDTFLDLADDENYRGFSITAPFKEDAFRRAIQPEEGARRTAAVNTLVRESGGWRGSNTDVPAVRDTILKALEFHAKRTDRSGGALGLHAAKVLILGAGGAARAAAWAMCGMGASVTVAGRTLARAEAVAADLSCRAIEWDAIPTEEYDVLIHTTPMGGVGFQDQLVIPAEWIRPDSVVLDAIYRPIKTVLLSAALERGATPVPGGEWFVRQAIAQFRLFTRGEPDEQMMIKSFEHAHEALGNR
ncbi:MAG: 3-dehydroquinate dehydratase/shikimate dehydrogenase [Planctomycetota bacterium]|jgi:3-dehydroquinate dehydratase/shikimate dehydrogenase